jgi:hypothetical protein
VRVSIEFWQVAEAAAPAVAMGAAAVECSLKTVILLLCPAGLQRTTATLQQGHRGMFLGFKGLQKLDEPSIYVSSFCAYCLQGNVTK